MAKKTTDKKPHTNPDDMFKQRDALKAEAAGETPQAQATPSETTPEVKAKKKGRVRGKKYQEKRSIVDKTKEYSIAEAVELVKKMSFSRFDGSVEAHLQVKEAGLNATLTYPHSTGKTVRAQIVSEEVIENISKGIIDFDVLIARPEDMKNIAKFARVLGPKGLMPNPKNGTVTPTPDKRKKELEAGAVTLKTEKKAPLIHTVVGKTSMGDQELVNNIQTLINAFENKALKLYICASMSPSVRVAIPKRV
jgi:large subunit ribosomal protein L1